MTMSIGTVYDDYIWRGENDDLAGLLYNHPPKTLGTVFERVASTIKAYQLTEWFTSDRGKTLKRVLTECNRQIGCLTEEVRKSITRLEGGAIEAAHQSVVMGGPCYILNKAATASRVASIGEEMELPQAPYYCIADYDVVQAELINIRTPLMGSEGNLISFPVPDGYEASPVYVIPLPEKSWLEETEESIRTNYHPMFKSLDGPTRLLYKERLEDALTIIRWAFINSKTISDFAQRIIGWLVNVRGELGVPLVPASNETIRGLLVTGLEFLLRADKRETFLRVQREVTNIILEKGYRPSFPARRDDYVPFFYECQNPECNRNRIELKYERVGSRAILHGNCSTCRETIELEVSAQDPDLTDHATHISPRVDSRQFVVDAMIPVTIHVGGPGEAAYYAQVIPIAQEMGVPFPHFIKYPRVYFNTPWNESLAKELREKGHPVLHSQEMFKIIGKANRFKKKRRYDEMNEKWQEFGEFLRATHKRINDTIGEMKMNIGSLPKEKQQEARYELLRLEQYLSWAFGQYSPEKLGQESSWSWIEWAINSGLEDLFGPYKRAYVAPLNNGATLFVNFST